MQGRSAPGASRAHSRLSVGGGSWDNTLVTGVFAQPGLRASFPRLSPRACSRERLAGRALGGWTEQPFLCLTPGRWPLVPREKPAWLVVSFARERSQRWKRSVPWIIVCCQVLVIF